MGGHLAMGGKIVALTAIDIAIIAAYFVLALGAGLWAGRGEKATAAEYFLGNRGIPWWIAGVSMAATAFSIDTPQYVVALVRNGGIGANWEWWCYLVGGLFGVFFLAGLWRRARVVTDAELCELRYGGPWAVRLRVFKALALGGVVNVIAMGLAIKGAMQILGPCLGLSPTADGSGSMDLWWLVGGTLIITFIYTAFSGLKGVVVTDALQFLLALVGSCAVAWFAVSAATTEGTLAAMAEGLRATHPQKLSLAPPAASVGDAVLTLAFLLGVQWWAFINADGGGKVIQRLSACATEADAARAYGLFMVLHYALRHWPWIVTGLATLLIWPELSTREAEGAYARVIVEHVPSVWRGIVVASLIAAYMSTIDTQLNWGAAYVVHDVILRGENPDVERPAMLRLARLVTAASLVLALLVAVSAESVTWLFRLLLAMGAGYGPISLLRWFWWRVNARTELAAMLASMITATALSVAGSGVEPWLKLSLPQTVGLTLAVSLVWALFTTLVTPAESPGTLAVFYARCQPPGFWGPVLDHTKNHEWRAHHPEGTPPRWAWGRLALWLLSCAGLIGIALSGAWILGLRP